MIKSIESFKKFNGIKESLKKELINFYSYFDEDFLTKINIILDRFDSLSIHELENIFSFIKLFKNKIEKFECNENIKNEITIFIDKCLSFINDLIMNEIIENI